MSGTRTSCYPQTMSGTRTSCYLQTMSGTRTSCYLQTMSGTRTSCYLQTMSGTRTSWYLQTMSGTRTSCYLQTMSGTRTSCYLQTMSGTRTSCYLKCNFELGVLLNIHSFIPLKCTGLWWTLLYQSVTWIPLHLSAPSRILCSSCVCVCKSFRCSHLMLSFSETVELVY